MEIKISCPCGQHYAFDVEPVNNAMPSGVNCPSCGADGTQLANEFIATTAATPPPPPPGPAPAPAPGGLRINRPAPAAVASSTSAPAVAPPRKIYTRAGEPDKPPPPSQERVLMGTVGGLIAGVIGMLIWYGLAVATGRHFGLVAWALGALTGVGVRTLGREGSTLLGLIAAICAAGAILGGQFLTVHVEVNKIMSDLGKTAYEAKMESAKQAVKVKSDEEIKKWLTQDGDGKSESEVTVQEIQDFRDKTQPEMQRLIDGTPSKAQFEANFNSKLKSMAFKYSVFKESISLFTILFVCFGVASAYRIASA
jgi:hypothetical protein